jgi:hypothetical protein
MRTESKGGEKETLVEGRGRIFRGRVIFGYPPKAGAVIPGRRIDCPQNRGKFMSLQLSP